MSEENKTLTDIRSDVCNATLIWLVFVAAIAVMGSLTRIVDFGWLPIMGVHVSIFSVLALTAVLRNKLPFVVRAGAVIMLYYLVGVGGHVTFGTPYALAYFVAGSLMTAVFFGEKAGIAAVVFSMLTAIGIYAVFQAGLLAPPPPPESTMIFTTWLTNTFAIAVVSIGPLIAISRFKEYLEGRRQRAESASKAKSDFLAMMSHELRTPMTAILGMSDLLMEEKLQGGQKEHVSRISKAGRHLLDLLNDILDFSKIEADKITIERIAFNPKELLEEA